MQHFLRQLVPFILFGIAIVAFAFGILLLAYLFLFGALVGLALFTVSWLRQKFFSATAVTKRPSSTIKKRGRTIDTDDWSKS